jgi:phenylalanine ammonia-lyase
LPPNLVLLPGINSGFKGMQLSQTSLVVGCRQLAGPSSIHTLPTEQYNQDIVSLGLHSSLTALEMSSLVRDALAILLLALCQSLDLRKRAEPDTEFGVVSRAIYHTIRTEVDFLETDRSMDQDIACVSQIIHRQGFELNLTLDSA